MSQLIQFEGCTVAVIAPEDLEELESRLARAEDAAAKGDLARQNAGGMQMRIDVLASDFDAKVRECERLRQDCEAVGEQASALILENERLRELLPIIRPMVESYRRKHERAYEAAERKMHTEYMEDHAETVAKCDRTLAAIDAALKEQP